MKIKRHDPVIIRRQVPYNQGHLIIVYNVASGTRNRYTVWLLPPSAGRAKIIGNEVPLSHAKQIVKNYYRTLELVTI